MLASPLTKGYGIALAIGGILPGSLTKVTGWGLTKENGSMSDKLIAVEVPIVSQEDCRSVYGQSAITSRMICAGLPEGGKDACQFDSGGPMRYANQLVGIVSWGYGCARPGFPGVYTKIAEVRKFIDKNTVLGLLH